MDTYTYSLSLNAMTSFQGTLLDTIKQRSMSSLAFLYLSFIFMKFLLGLTENPRVLP